MAIPLVAWGAAALLGGSSLYELVSNRFDEANPAKFEGPLRVGMAAFRDFERAPWQAADTGTGFARVVYQGVERIAASRAIQDIPAATRIDLANAYGNDPEKLGALLRDYAAAKVEEYRADPSTLGFGQVATSFLNEKGPINKIFALGGSLANVAHLAVSRRAGKSTSFGAELRHGIEAAIPGDIENLPVLKQTMGLVEHGSNLSLEVFADPISIGFGASKAISKVGSLSSKLGAVDDIESARAVVDSFLDTPGASSWLQRMIGKSPTFIKDEAAIAGWGLDWETARELSELSTHNVDDALAQARELIFERSLSRKVRAIGGDSTSVADSLHRKAAQSRFMARSYPRVIDTNDPEHVDHLRRRLTHLYGDAAEADAKINDLLSGSITFGVEGERTLTGLRYSEFADLEIAAVETFARRHGKTAEDVADYTKGLRDWVTRVEDQSFGSELLPHPGYVGDEKPFLTSQLRYAMPVMGYWDTVKMGVALSGGEAAKFGVAVTNTLDNVRSVLAHTWLAKSVIGMRNSIDEMLRLRANPEIGYRASQYMKDKLLARLTAEQNYDEPIKGLTRYLLPKDLTGEAAQKIYLQELHSGAKARLAPDLLAENYSRLYAGSNGPVSAEDLKVIREKNPDLIDSSKWTVHDRGTSGYTTALAHTVNNQMLNDPIMATAIDWLDLDDLSLTKKLVEKMRDPAVGAGMADLGVLKNIAKQVRSGEVPLDAVSQAARVLEADDAVSHLDSFRAAVVSKFGEQGGQIVDDLAPQASGKTLSAFARKVGKAVDDVDTVRKLGREVLRDGFKGLDSDEVAKVLWAQDMVAVVRSFGDAAKDAKSGVLSISRLEQMLADPNSKLPPKVWGPMWVDHDLSKVATNDLLKMAKSTSLGVMGYGGKIIDQTARRPAYQQAYRKEFARQKALAKMSPVPVSDEVIARAAENKVRAEMFTTVDTVGNRVVFDEWLSHFVPFYDAQMRFMRFWVKNAKHNPQMIERTRALTRWGLNAGYIEEDPEGTLTASVPVPAFLADTVGHKSLRFRIGDIQPDGLADGLLMPLVPVGVPFSSSVMPGLHPMISLPIDHLTRWSPGLNDLRKHLLGGRPLPKDDDSWPDIIAGSMGLQWMQNMVDAINPSSDDVDLNRGGAYVDALAYLAYRGENINDEKVQERAAKIARINLFTKGLLGFGSPWSGSPIPFGQEIKNSLNELRAEHGFEEGTAQFLDRWGDEAFFYTVPKSEAKHYGLGTGEYATRMLKQHKNLFEKYGDAAGFLTADEGVEEKAAILDSIGEQIRLGARVTLPPTEWLAHAMFRAGNKVYYDDVLPQLEAALEGDELTAAKAAARAQIDQLYPGWLKAWGSSERRERRESALVQLMQLVEEPQVAEHPGIEPVRLFLADYQTALQAAHQLGRTDLSSNDVAHIRAALVERFKVLDQRYDSEMFRTVYDYLFRFDLEG